MNHETTAQRRPDVNKDAHRRRAWVNRVMIHVRKAAQKKHHALLESVAESAATSRGRALPGYWSPAAARLGHSSEYRLADLLAFSDADFIEQCYRTALRRGPDPEGFRTHLARMQRGEATKVEILGDIRFSSEGRAKGVHIDGLLMPYTLNRWMRKPKIGKLLSWAYGLVRVGELAERQNILDTAQARETHALGHHLNRVTAAVEEELAAIELVSASKADLDTVQSLGERCEEAEFLLDTLDHRIDSNRVVFEQQLANKVNRDLFRDELEAISKRVSPIEAHAKLLQSLGERYEGVESSLNKLGHAFESNRTSLELRLDSKADRDPFRNEIATLTERMTSIETHSATLIDGSALQVELSGLIERLQKFENKLREQVDANDEVKRRIDSASGELHERLGGLEQKAASGEDLVAITNDLVATGGRLEGLDARLSGVIAEIETKAAKSAELKQDFDGFYAAFEGAFRGSRESIRERLEPYLQWIRDAQAGSAEFPVLDIGCGRGEWLELMRDHQMIATGIDVNRVFVDYCKDCGLDVEFSDAIAHLDARQAGSLGAITAMHVVEHLEFETMIAMIDRAKRALRSGGLLILETPNPENVTVGSCNFYLDPTHRNPIPPIALRWMVEARGFPGARIERLTHARELPSWEPPAADSPGADAIITMSNAFAAAPDYAIIAVRP